MTRRPAPVPPSRAKGVTRRGALQLALVGGLAGCGLSTDPTVRPGLDIDAPAEEGLTYVPPGPQDGDGPEETVRGFMRAGATTGAQLEVARSFLTTEAGQAWLPDAQTVVYGGTTPKIRRIGKDRYQADIRVIARIDADSRYIVSPPYDGATFEFGLRRDGDGWLIDRLQDGFGRVLHKDAVGRMYRLYSVHYPAIGWNALVSDLRWIPQDQQTTRLTRAQLGRLPDYLRGAAQTDGRARLTVDAVPVVEGVAQVDLAPETVRPDATVRKQLAAQLVATLRQLPEVSEVSILLGGSALELPGIDAPLVEPEQLGFADPHASRPQVLVRVGTRLLPVAGRQLSSVSVSDLDSGSAGFAPVLRSWRRLALSPDAKEVAGVSGEATEIARWRADGTVHPVPTFATDLTRPVYDYGGVLWVAGQGVGTQDGTSVWAINAAADIHDERASAPTGLATPWLEDRLVQSLAVSPEGSRIAVVSVPPGGGSSILEVAGVARSANGLPTSFSRSTLRVAARLVVIRDVVWVGSTTLAVIGREDKERALRPYLVEVGGEITRLPQQRGAVEVTSAGGKREIVLGDGKRRVWTRTGARWQLLSTIEGVVVAGA